MMQEIIQRIEDNLSRGLNMMDFHLLHRELAIPSEIFWLSVNITADFYLWSAGLTAKAGVKPEVSVLAYLGDIAEHSRNILAALKETNVGSVN